MKASLVIMAAGLGARYGGIKQIEPVGPAGEILMEYSIYDAIRFGVSKVVYIVRPDILEDVKRLSGNRLAGHKTADGRPVQVEYVLQSLSNLPAFYRVPEGRTKPMGTVHAVLCAKDVVNEPFVVINADDYYGVEALPAVFRELEKMEPEGMACMVGYRLKNTVYDFGAVTRGISRQKDGLLQGIKETYKIRRFPDGTIRDTGISEKGRVLDPDCLVSMNIWGFTPWIFKVLEDCFHEFLRSLPPEDMSSECLLPVAIDAMVREKQLLVAVLETGSTWLGITYKEDRDFVSDELKKLHDRGIYPLKLY
ncbi:MAG: hypothetical protein GX254_01955 [Clostridiales bacterium]|jgi:UTP-glucose-1-phosphate uridylyltransferase|nr:hypothetical protein [Clostridiales bacterium]